MSETLRNPILPGFYPDPSICRVGNDFYLVTSTFEYFPGLPIFHSRDLVHWHQIGHVLERESQLPLRGIRSSGGIYAPTIRYFNGVYYVITTLVDGKIRSGNFIVMATDPAGPWSEPHWLEDAPGFDPSLFFDDDCRVWYTGNQLSENGHYKGHTEIWLQEIDLASMRLIGKKHILWDGAFKQAVWAEAPHLYKIGGWYYLLIAEGGTAHEHAVTIARSRRVTGPYEVNLRNPILTHRHLGLDYPIVGTGHADLIDTPSGEWWMVLLAMRPYSGYYYNLGRETFMAPVRWEDEWPVVSPGTGRVEHVYPAPNLPLHPWPAVSCREDFDAPPLALHWNFLRTPPQDFISLSERPGYLRIHLRPSSLKEESNPSFVGRRQQHICFEASAAIEFKPQSENESAGFALLQNNDYFFLFVITDNNGPVLRLIRRVGGKEEQVAEQPVETKRLYLKVEAHEQVYCFHYATIEDEWHTLAGNVDGRILSTPVAGGFLGTYIALYASSNGMKSTNQVDVDWFEYRGLGEV